MILQLWAYASRCQPRHFQQDTCTMLPCSLFWKSQGSSHLAIILPAPLYVKQRNRVRLQLNTSREHLTFLCESFQYGALSRASLWSADIAREKNDDADLLSRWDGTSPLPAHFPAIAWPAHPHERPEFIYLWGTFKKDIQNSPSRSPAIAATSVFPAPLIVAYSSSGLNRLLVLKHCNIVPTQKEIWMFRTQCESFGSVEVCETRRAPIWKHPVFESGD